MVGQARDPISTRRLVRSLITALALAGCGAEVTLEDDDDGGSAAGDGSSEGQGGDDGNGATSGSGADGAGASAANGGASGTSGVEALADAQAACTDYYYSCNGNQSLFSVGLYDCNTLDILPECAPALAALYRCATQPGGSRYAACDVELEDRCKTDLWFEFAGCMNPNYCGSHGPPECAATGSECSCTEACDDGHVARMDCVGGNGTADYETCDCYFDGALVGSCGNEVWDSGCMVRGSCCETLMR